MKKTVHITAPDKIGQIAPEIYGHFSEHIGGVFYGGIWVGKDSKTPNIGVFKNCLIDRTIRSNRSVKSDASEKLPDMI